MDKFTVMEWLAGKWRPVWSFNTKSEAEAYAAKLGTTTKVVFIYVP